MTGPAVQYVVSMRAVYNRACAPMPRTKLTATAQDSEGRNSDPYKRVHRQPKKKKKVSSDGSGRAFGWMMDDDKMDENDAPCTRRSWMADGGCGEGRQTCSGRYPNLIR